LARGLPFALCSRWIFLRLAWGCLVSVLLCGCTGDRQQATSNKSNHSESDSTQVNSSEIGYRKIFSSGLPQNVITSRMNLNFDQFWKKDLPDDKLVHFRSAGLKIYQPANSEVGERFTGFFNPNVGFSLVVVTNPFSMKETTRQLVENEIRADGARILFSRNLEFDDQTGVFYATRIRLTEQEAGKYILAFGDDSYCRILTATMKVEAEEQVGEELLRSLLGVQVASEPRLPPGEDVDFTMQSNRLKMTAGFVNKLVYTLDGNFPEQTLKFPIFQAGRPVIGFSTDDPDERRAFAHTSILPLTAFSVSGVSTENEITIDGLPGFEFIALGKDEVSQEPLVIYSVTLFDTDDVYIMHGWVSTDSSENYVSDFRSLAKSFKRKPEAKATQQSE
jgi:hypothetical protein